MDFYTEVTVQNALDWYKELPPHLKKTIDEKKVKFTNGRTCSQKECPDIFQQVKQELGTRPLRPADPADPLDGHTIKQIEQFSKHKTWGERYDELLLIKLILEDADGIQRERKALAAALGMTMDVDGLPNQADGLDDTQAATVRWLQQQGETPLEFLVSMYKDTEAKPSDRINAASKLMDYVHRKVPVKTEVETKDVTAPKLATDQLRNLSPTDRANLERILTSLAPAPAPKKPG